MAVIYDPESQLQHRAVAPVSGGIQTLVALEGRGIQRCYICRTSSRAPSTFVALAPNLRISRGSWRLPRPQTP